ncbi:hypothetical protein PYJ54_11795 [Staphylococcus epidermidis]|nr:hypothetical protein [Staphylococcus epidermidis]
MDIISDGGDIYQNNDGIYEINQPDGQQLLVADLVDEKLRDKVTSYLANITDDIKDLDKLDIIIALGMAKEGFDYCGYRNSLNVRYIKHFKINKLYFKTVNVKKQQNGIFYHLKK